MDIKLLYTTVCVVQDGHSFYLFPSLPFLPVPVPLLPSIKTIS